MPGTRAKLLGWAAIALVFGIFFILNEMRAHILHFGWFISCVFVCGAFLVLLIKWLDGQTSEEPNPLTGAKQKDQPRS